MGTVEEIFRLDFKQSLLFLFGLFLMAVVGWMCMCVCVYVCRALH